MVRSSGTRSVGRRVSAHLGSMQDQAGSNHDGGRSALSLPTPSANTTRTESFPEPRDRAHLEMFHIPVNEACVGTPSRYLTRLMNAFYI